MAAPRTAPDRVRLRVALYGALVVATVALTLCVGLLSGVDAAVRDWFLTHRDSTLTSVLTGITTVGSTPVLVVVALAVTVYFVTRHQGREALMVGVTTTVAVVLGPLLKEIVGRVRPADEHLVAVSSWAYPSGHALTATVVLGLLTVLAARRIATRAARIAVVTVGVVLIVAVGLSRVYLGVHWPTDVVAGWLVGVLWLGLCMEIFPREPSASHR